MVDGFAVLLYCFVVLVLWHCLVACGCFVFVWFSGFALWLELLIVLVYV